MYDIKSKTPNPHGWCNLPPTQRSDACDGEHDPDREMDPNKTRNYADQYPLSDFNIIYDIEV